MAYKSKSSRKGVDVLRMTGDLDASEMVRMKGRLNRLVNKNHKKLAIDMRAIERVELAGVGILVDRLRHVRECKGDIKLFNVRPEVVKTFQMIGVGSLMETYNSEAEAVQSFAA